MLSINLNLNNEVTGTIQSHLTVVASVVVIRGYSDCVGSIYPLPLVQVSYINWARPFIMVLVQRQYFYFVLIRAFDQFVVVNID